MRHAVSELHPPRLYPRNVATRVRAALTDTPVVVIHGARQSGKSTLARELIREGYPAEYISLDDSATLATARRDPDGFIAAFRGPLVIDEVQRAPDLFRAIKAEVDRRRTPGRFVLTGSANVLLLPTISESLAGRVEVVTLWPLSQSEIEGRKDTVVDALFSDELPAVDGGDDLRRDVLERAIRGGYPEALAREDAGRRREWFTSYVETIVQREVRDVSAIEGLLEIPALLALLGARAMTVLNMADLARVLRMSHRTLIRYMALLEMTFVVQRIPAWAGELGRRLIRHPKVMLADSGLLGHFLRLETERLPLDERSVGPLLENFAASELLKCMNWSDYRPSLYHFRTGRDEEVDLVLEGRGRRLVGVEVKASSSVTWEDFSSLRVLADATGRRFVRGIVLYTGRRHLPFGPKMHALPISALWKM